MNTLLKCVMSNDPVINWTTKMLQIKWMKVLSEGHKNHFEDQCLIKLQWTFLIFHSLFDSVSWWCHQNYVNQITSNDRTLWILDLPIFNVFVWLCWLWIFPWIKLFWYSCFIWDRLERLSWFRQCVFVRGYLSLTGKDTLLKCIFV